MRKVHLSCASLLLLLALCTSVIVFGGGLNFDLMWKDAENFLLLNQIKATEWVCLRSYVQVWYSNIKNAYMMMSRIHVIHSLYIWYRVTAKFCAKDWIYFVQNKCIKYVSGWVCACVCAVHTNKFREVLNCVAYARHKIKHAKRLLYTKRFARSEMHQNTICLM